MQFPIRVRLCHSGTEFVANSVDDLPAGVSFRIEGPSFRQEAQAAYDAVKSDPESVVTLIERWIDTAAQNERNCAYYRELVTTIGDMFGGLARVSDDGRVQDSVLPAKVPGLVGDLIRTHKSLRMSHSKKVLSLQAIGDAAGYTPESPATRLRRIMEIVSASLS